MDSPEHARHIHPFVLTGSSRSRNLQPTHSPLIDYPTAPACQAWSHVTHIKLFVTRHLNNLPLIGWLVGFPRSQATHLPALPGHRRQRSANLSAAKQSSKLVSSMIRGNFMKA